MLPGEIPDEALEAARNLRDLANKIDRWSHLLLAESIARGEHPVSLHAIHAAIEVLSQLNAAHQF